jgi:hypothetical protein
LKPSISKNCRTPSQKKKKVEIKTVSSVMFLLFALTAICSVKQTLQSQNLSFLVGVFVLFLGDELLFLYHCLIDFICLFTAVLGIKSRACAC